MKRLLKAAAALVCAFGFTFAHAQMTTITASSIKTGGVAIATGTVTFTPVNLSGIPIAFAAGGGGLNSPMAFSCTITAGAISGSCSIPDAALTTPANILYSVQITNTTTQKSFTLQQVANITGSTWPLDHYGPPSPTTNVQAVQSAYGTAAPPASCVTPSFYIRNYSGGQMYACVGGVFVLINGAPLSIGTTSGTAAEGNDSRFAVNATAAAVAQATSINGLQSSLATGSQAYSPGYTLAFLNETTQPSYTGETFVNNATYFRYIGTKASCITPKGSSSPQNLYYIDFGCSQLEPSVVWGVQFYLNTSSMQVKWLDQNFTGVQVFVDGQPATPDAYIGTANTGTDTFNFTFPGIGHHRIEVYSVGGTALRSIVTPNGSADLQIADWNVGPRNIFMGDSFTQGTGSEVYTPYAFYAAHLLNFDGWDSGCGGSGYVVAGACGYNAAARVATDVAPFCTSGGYITWNFGYNDVTQSTEQAGAYNAYHAAAVACPNTTQLVFGSWQPQSGATPSWKATTIQAAVAQAVAEGDKVYWVGDPTAENWIYGSTTDPSSGNASTYTSTVTYPHPNKNGHKWIGWEEAMHELRQWPSVAGWSGTSTSTSFPTQPPVTGIAAQWSEPFNSLVGTITATSASTSVTGVGTMFTRQLAAGDTIWCGPSNAFTGIIATVNSDTSLTLTVGWGHATQTAQPYNLLASRLITIYQNGTSVNIH